jgi:hypothetical protein
MAVLWGAAEVASGGRGSRSTSATDLGRKGGHPRGLVLDDGVVGDWTFNKVGGGQL